MPGMAVENPYASLFSSSQAGECSAPSTMTAIRRSSSVSSRCRSAAYAMLRTNRRAGRSSSRTCLIEHSDRETMERRVTGLRDHDVRDRAFAMTCDPVGHLFPEPISVGHQRCGEDLHAVELSHHCDV